MAVINIEVPILILVAALALAAVTWAVGTFTSFLREHRYRVAFGLVAFAVSGLMGFFSVLKLELGAFGDWLSAHPLFITLAVAYLGYMLFGFLGCWTAVRIGGRMDRKHTLAILYSLAANRKKPDGA